MLQPLRVCDSGRYFVHDDGSPFFYLADTAWELFHRLSLSEAETYLRDRAAKGFTAIQAVVLGECDGLTVPNANGDLPLIDQDPARPNEPYFEHVDAIVHLAASLRLRIAMLPTWGCYVRPMWAADAPIIFDPANAREYGGFLGDRYREAPIIWINGGDRPPIDNDVEIWRSLAAGIRDAGADQLMTFHPMGGHGSSQWFHKDDWLDFNMWQSGHGHFRCPNWKLIDADWQRSPVKPVLDGEPCYENHPIAFNPGNGYFNDHDVRCAAYWAVFHGAAGHTYGCHDIWQMHAPDWQPVSTSRAYWFDSIHLPGSTHVGHLRRLIESRTSLTRFAASGLIRSACVEAEQIVATRDGSPGESDATFLLVYSPYLRRIEVDTDCLAADRLDLWRFNPRDGSAERVDTIDNTGVAAASPPDAGPDWVLVVEAAERYEHPPGHAV